MSESRFVEECGRRFREKHRAGDGWTVFRIDPGTWGIYTPLLPAFLMARAPKSATRKDLYFDVGWTEGRRRSSLSELPWRRRGRGMDEGDWYGEVEFVWREAPIHYARYPYRGIERESESTWIATKSRAAFEDLWRGLVAFKRRHFSARREIEVVNGGWLPRPRFDWNDLVLPDGMAAEIRRHAEAFLAARKHYKALRLPYRRGFLFAGPPGVGKTFAVKVLYSKLRASAFALDLKAETKDRDLKRAFDAAAESAPSVLLLEDLDRIVGSKEVSMSFLLNLLDGLEPKEGLLVVATTNAPEKLDQALLHRPSRFDRVWHFPLPGLPERLRLMEKRGQGHFSREALKRAAERSVGFTMAYAQEAVVSALLTALFEKRAATDADLLASVDELAEQVREGHKKDGLLKADAPVGFSASSNGRERAAAE